MIRTMGVLRRFAIERDILIRADTGRWMITETERVFQQIRDAGKKINPDFAFAVEEPCEYLFHTGISTWAGPMLFSLRASIPQLIVSLFRCFCTSTMSTCSRMVAAT